MKDPEESSQYKTYSPTVPPVSEYYLETSYKDNSHQNDRDYQDSEDTRFVD